MAKDVKIGDIVKWEGYKYRVTSVTNDSHNWILGHDTRTTSNLLMLKALPFKKNPKNIWDCPEEPGGWINERTVILIKKKRK